MATALGAETGERSFPGGSWAENLGFPMTAHFLGGAVIGATPADGVIDPYHRVWGYPGLHITDGSAISANLGVNPSLTITAQAERAMSLWPNGRVTWIHDPRRAHHTSGLRAVPAQHPALRE
jgi:cholesterol oxidase